MLLAEVTYAQLMKDLMKEFSSSSLHLIFTPEQNTWQL